MKKFEPIVNCGICCGQNPMYYDGEPFDTESECEEWIEENTDNFTPNELGGGIYPQEIEVGDLEWDEVNEAFDNWSEINSQLFQASKDYIKKILLSLPNHSLDISECNVCVTYDGGRHPEYDANPYSCVENVCYANGKIYLSTEDTSNYDIENINAYELYNVAEGVMTSYNQDYE